MSALCNLPVSAQLTGISLPHRLDCCWNCVSDAATGLCLRHDWGLLCSEDHPIDHGGEFDDQGNQYIYVSVYGLTAPSVVKALVEQNIAASMFE